MINRRIIVNLAVFLGVFVLLAYWAVSNVVKFDFIERPYRVTAYFSNSPGLRDGFEVAYLGLRVGSIGQVELIDDPSYCTPASPAATGVPEGAGDGQALTGACVAVELKIDRGTELPGNVTPFVRRKSAVGEPYVDLVVAPGGAEGRLEAGDHLVDGRIPLAYSDLFRAVNDLVQAVPEEALGTFFHELAIGLEGRADDIRRIIEGAHDLTGTLAEDPEFLDELSEQLTTLTHTLAEHRGSFGSAVDDLALLAETLAENRAVLAEFLDTSPQFVSQLTGLLDAVGGDLTCALRSLSVVATSLSQPATLAQVDRLLEVAAEAGDVLGGSFRFLPDGEWITGGFQFNPLNDTPVAIYPEPLVLPEPPEVRTCDVTIPTGDDSGDVSGAGAGGTASPEAGDSPRPATERPAAAPDNFPDSTDRPLEDDPPLGGLLPYVGILLVLAVLAGVLRPWRWLAKQDGGSTDIDDLDAMDDTGDP